MNAAAFLSRLSTILAALAALIAARLLRHPTLARHNVPLWTYLRHLPDRVERAFTHPPRPRAPRKSRPRAEESTPRPTWRLPTSPAWLVRVLGSEAACYASQLRCLLAEPGAQAILVASPAAQRRLLPLARILIPAHWDNPFPCAQRPNTPKPSAPNPVPCPPAKLA